MTVTSDSSKALTQLTASGRITPLLQGLRELNRIIDEQLPSHRPRFQRAETELDGIKFDVYYRDVIACIRALFADKAFAPYLLFAPERHYTDETRQNRLYHDMHTGKWWWTTQVSVYFRAIFCPLIDVIKEKLEARRPGATIIPVIIASDKTQVALFAGKSMYPVYITIGNIPKELRRKVSKGAQILLAYLPTTQLEHVTNQAAKRRMLANIFHKASVKYYDHCMRPGSTGFTWRAVMVSLAVFILSLRHTSATIWRTSRSWDVKWASVHAAQYHLLSWVILI